MKPQSFRAAMNGLHTWSGLLLGWVCFAIFLTGTATYYRWEITRWMQPELRPAGTPGEAAAAAVARLEHDAASSPQWAVDLPDGRQVATRLFWRNPAPGPRFQRATIDPRTGEDVTARDTRGGEFFYRFHFQLQLPHPWGRYLAGLAALAMVVALVSGIVTHRQFFADFFTFRPGRGGFRSWLDFHNLTAVFALPFYLMITYSALVIFIGLYMPWGRQILAETKADVSAAPAPPPPPRSTPWITPAPLAPMLRVVTDTWGTDGPTLRRIDVADRGTDRCTVTFTRATGAHVSLAAQERLRFDGVTGTLVTTPPAQPGLGQASHDLLYGLHLARFAGPALRGLFLVMGLAGTALIATGLILWTIKRRPQQTGPRLTFSHGLVERLNLATLAGLPLAYAAFFWANRVLPVDLASRSDMEVRVLLWAWGVALLHAGVRPVFAGWREQLHVGAALFLLLPVGDAVLAGEHLRAALHLRDTAYLGVNAALFLCGAALWAAARRLRVTRPTSAAAAPVASVVADSSP